MGNNMKDVELKLIRELMKNCRRSDRELAKVVGVSQPTVSRIIKKLESEGYLEYTAVPNLVKLGYRILAVNIGRRIQESQPEVVVQKSTNFVKNHPNLLLVARGLSSNGDRIAISAHKDFGDYCRLMQEIKEEWPAITTVTSFLIDLTGDYVLRNLSYKYMREGV